MRVTFRLAAFTMAIFLASASARATDDTNIADYKCAQFLEDVMKPKESVSLLRSMLVIAWSTGYAAAYQKDNARADPKALRLIAASLASACAQNPDKMVVQAGVEEVHRVFNEQLK